MSTFYNYFWPVRDWRHMPSPSCNNASLYEVQADCAFTLFGLYVVPGYPGIDLRLQNAARHSKQQVSSRNHHKSPNIVDVTRVLLLFRILWCSLHVDCTLVKLLNSSHLRPGKDSPCICIRTSAACRSAKRPLLCDCSDSKSSSVH